MAKLYPTRPFMMMLYGYPGAGKSYFARQFCENVQATHLQADRIRNELFSNPQFGKQENEIVTQLMDYMASEFLSAGLSVVYDAGVIRSAQRQTLRQLATANHALPILVWFQMDSETAFTRNQKRDRRRVDDKFTKQLDRKTFDNVLAHMQNPSHAEDYLVASGKHLFSMQLSAAISKLRSMGVISTDDMNSRVIKPGMVNLVPSLARYDNSRRNISIR